jgi:hypothetical protein
MKRHNHNKDKNTTYKKSRASVKKVKCPVWVASPVSVKRHPEMDAVLARPFISTVFFNPATKSFGYPVPNKDAPHVLGGLHARMKTKFFRGVELPKKTKIVGKPRKMPSSKGDGSRADRELERAIASGAFPLADEGIGGAYARAVWDHWASMGHTPIVAQLPVVIVRANVCTAGDYFTVGPDGGLHLWELKTGWPYTRKDGVRESKMSEPLAHVENTAFNRWQLQVELTRMAYQREMGMKIDQSHVIHAWREREEGYHKYTTRVRVMTHEDLTPPGWPASVDMDAVYARL